MNNGCCEEKTVQTCRNTSSGLVLAVVLYILLVIILSSFRNY